MRDEFHDEFRDEFRDEIVFFLVIPKENVNTMSDEFGDEFRGGLMNFVSGCFFGGCGDDFVLKYGRQRPPSIPSASLELMSFKSALARISA